ncbi:LLM class flavin-dependent oxidoreductase [Kitasatospora sp. NPDC018058]|uniref:LLM class flavin-dependent oxidoreductase n=1 Tax=Kitasatospora sp. NPDC018058 TaxID=3364025 RepID=UPI0037BE6FB7
MTLVSPLVRPAETSLIYPLQPANIGEIVPVARLLQARGRGRLWLGQSMGIDTHQLFAGLTGMGLRIPFGTSVVLSPLRHPLDAALQARSVAALSGAPYVAGIGPGGAEFQRLLRREAYPKPVSAVAEYLAVMRGLLAGERVDQDGDHFSTHTALTPLPSPPVELGLGVLRPPMARAAGRAADVAITWLTPAPYLRDVLVPSLAAAAESATRPTPRVATVVHVAVARPGRDIGRTAYHAASAHLRLPHYTDMLRQAGVAADPGHPEDGAKALIDNGVFVAGTPEEIADGLDQYRRAGVDEVVLNVCGVTRSEGLGAGLRDLTEILEAVDDRRP